MNNSLLTGTVHINNSFLEGTAAFNNSQLTGTRAAYFKLSFIRQKIETIFAVCIISRGYPCALVAHERELSGATYLSCFIDYVCTYTLKFFIRSRNLACAVG